MRNQPQSFSSELFADALVRLTEWNSLPQERDKAAREAHMLSRGGLVLIPSTATCGIG